MCLLCVTDSAPHRRMVSMWLTLYNVCLNVYMHRMHCIVLCFRNILKGFERPQPTATRSSTSS